MFLSQVSRVGLILEYIIHETLMVSKHKELSMKDLKEKETLSHKAGDKLERVGEKVSDLGAKKIGKKIYDAGNKLEHKDDIKKK